MTEEIRNFVNATKSWTNVARYIAAAWGQPYLVIIESIQRLAYTKYDNNEYAAAVALLRKFENLQSNR